MLTCRTIRSSGVANVSSASTAFCKVAPSRLACVAILFTPAICTQYRTITIRYKCVRSRFLYNECMKKRDRAYEWWKRKPSNVRKPLVLTLGMLLVVISPFTGILPGPGGIPVFLLGIAILASEYDWADRIKLFILKVAPEWVKNTGA